MRSSNVKQIAILLTMILLLPVVIVSIFLFGAGAYQATNTTTSTCITGPGKLPDAVPQPLNSIFTAAAEQYNVPPYVVALLYFGENGSYREPPPPYGEGDFYRSSPVGAQGPFQFMPGTWSVYKNSNPAHQPGNVQDLTDAAFAAAHYAQAELGATKDMTFGSLDNFTTPGTALRVFANYNRGPYAPTVSAYHNTETLRYVKIIDGEFRAHYMLPVTPEPPDLDPALSTCGDAVEIPSTSQTNGYANTGSLQCFAGKDAGIAKTAKGNVIRLCNVGGFVVNTSLSQRVERLLAYAEQDGVILQGSAFRTNDEQIALRRQNCGTSRWAIYEKPPQLCSPNTAIPGTSRHEQGLALDINGVGGYYTPVFNVIGKHAAKSDVDLYNIVPTEYWHWDIGEW